MKTNNPLGIDTELMKLIKQWQSKPNNYYTEIENWVNSGERLQKAKQIVIDYLKEKKQLDVFEYEYHILSKRTNTTLLEINYIVDLVVYEIIWE